jgi:hypothetical protein
MIVKGIKSINIDGKEYWSVKQFAELTDRSEGSIRQLIDTGNRNRKLRADRIASKPFIEAQELFDFPFLSNGRPSPLGTMSEKYILKDGDLTIEEQRLD